MIKVGIVGYGNLGKAVERDILINSNFQLVKIFSRRNIKMLQSPFNNEFENINNLQNYAGDIDLLFLCGGSFSDIEEIGLKAVKNFCTVDAFDTHGKLHEYKRKLDLIAKENKTVGLTAFGWDPGILSQIRTIFAGIAGQNNVSTFWGYGISQGHSDALRRLEGVENAVQFTVPNKKEMRKVLTQANYSPNDKDKHRRVCYVALKVAENDAKLSENVDKFTEKSAKNQQKNGQKQQKNSKKTAKNSKILIKNSKKTTSFLKKSCSIRKKIENMPNYFAGQKTIVRFVGNEKIVKLQKDMKHKGVVISHFKLTKCYNAKMKFEIEMQNNPALTARVMTIAGKIAIKFYEEKKYGGYSILDIPPKYFLNESDNLL